jgi:hypothetical protein
VSAVPCRAQEAPVATGIHLRFPSFTADLAAQAAQTPPPTTSTTTQQGGVQIPGAPTTASHAQQAMFKPNRMTKVIQYGLQLTFYEHIMRVATQDFTRQQLEGPFWQDYLDSVNMPEKWGDKDGWEVNYIGHAIHGGAFSRIWLEQMEPKPTSKSQYLKSIGKAFIYTAIFSMQYEIGPMSEASIGNVGMNPDDNGWVDLIWTPVGSVLWTMGEDAIDKYALRWIEKHVPFMMAKGAARMILNPSRMLANISMNRSPWSRADRDWNGVNKR